MVTPAIEPVKPTRSAMPFQFAATRVQAPPPSRRGCYRTAAQTGARRSGYTTPAMPNHRPRERARHVAAKRAVVPKTACASGVQVDGHAYAW